MNVQQKFYLTDEEKRKVDSALKLQGVNYEDIAKQLKHANTVDERVKILQTIPTSDIIQRLANMKIFIDFICDDDVDAKWHGYSNLFPEGGDKVEYATRSGNCVVGYVSHFINIRDNGTFMTPVLVSQDMSEYSIHYGPTSTLKRLCDSEIIRTGGKNDKSAVFSTELTKSDLQKSLEKSGWDFLGNADSKKIETILQKYEYNGIARVMIEKPYDANAVEINDGKTQAVYVMFITKLGLKPHSSAVV